MVFQCDIAGSDSDRWLEIRAWIFDRSARAKVRLVADAHVALSALVGALHDRPAESNVSDSIVSSLSRDPNRGDAHARPEQVEAGAPPRASSNRFVRRRTTDDRPDVRIVRAANEDTGSTPAA